MSLRSLKTGSVYLSSHSLKFGDILAEGSRQQILIFSSVSPKLCLLGHKVCENHHRNVLKISQLWKVVTKLTSGLLHNLWGFAMLNLDNNYSK